MTDSAPVTLETIARLLDQTIEEQRETRARIDAHIKVTTLQFEGFEKLFEGVRSTTTAQFLTLAGQIADMQKQLVRIEDHVGFLTTKVTAYDKRFDDHDKRFDQIDQRLDAHDKRFDAHDKRFDRIDQRLDGLTQLVEQIRDAVLPPKP